MSGLFSRLKGKDSKSKKRNAAADLANLLPAKPQWDDAWTRKFVEPEEVHELLYFCGEELKARGLDLPFLLLPFRPTSDPSAVRTFIRHFFKHDRPPISGEHLIQELRMIEPMVLSGVVKWCWSRLQGGVVGWDAYELFKVGEYDSSIARDSFKTFIPLSVENGARQRIIFDFFNLVAAIAAHGKSNGLGGRKLSRMAAWWAFEQKDTGSGFEGGYNAWLTAADATSHLFFAYLRSLAPEKNVTGISMLPMSLQKLLQETEYPPQRPEMMMTRTNKVVMIVDSVSPTPFALLRRANHFQYRDSDRALQEFSEYDDPIQALSEECKRVLKAVSSANQSQVSSSKHSTSLRDASWSRFEDLGFSSTLDEEDEEDDSAFRQKKPQGLRTTPMSGNGLGRPTTPSWADFLSSGFVDEDQSRPQLLLPPDKVLPPIDTQTRQRSSQSHRPRLESDQDLEPGELASITFIDLDDAFWWVWMSSLAPEETPERKAAFGRCAVVETKIRSGRWLVMEEMVAGAAPEPRDDAYIAEKKGLFSWTRRGRTLGRSKSTGKQALERGDKNANNAAGSKISIGPDTHAKIQAKAAQLRAENERQQLAQATQRQNHMDLDLRMDKGTSVLTLQSNLVGEASPAMKWVKNFDKGNIKDAYMSNSHAGRGLTLSPVPSDSTNGHSGANGFTQEPEQAPEVPRKEIPRKEAPASPRPAAHPPAPPPAPVPAPTPAPAPAVAPVSVPAAAPMPQRKPLRKPPPQPKHKLEKPRPEPKPEPKPKPEVVPEKEAQKEQPPEPVHEPEPAPLPSPVFPAEVAAPPQAPAEPAPVAVAPAVEAKDGKKAQKKPSGLKKLFARKNRSSKLPETASKDLNTMLRPGSETPEPVPVQSPTAVAAPAPNAAPEGDRPVPTEGHAPDAKEQTSGGETLSRVDTQDEAEAKREFSRFDQGPLSDQPAFVPDSDGEDDATPPPIARHPPTRSTPSLKSSHELLNEEKLSQTASPGVQDRWAQIRKNAAERAAQYERNIEDPGRYRHSKATDNDDDTSGEESLESRVARIKARVAELTGSMEGVNGPGTPPHASSPRTPQAQAEPVSPVSR